MKSKRVISIITAMMIFAAGVTALPAFAEGESGAPYITSPLAPTGLLTNELENPLNVEEPTFGWLVNDTNQNAVQSAYRIVVTDEITGEAVWDSGKVQSSEQSYIPFGGTANNPYEYEIGPVQLVDGADGSKQLISAAVSQTIAGDDENAVVTAAAYDDGNALKQVVTAPVTPNNTHEGAKVTHNINFETPLTIPQGGSGKLFVWKGESIGETMEPVSAVYDALTHSADTEETAELEEAHPYSWQVQTWNYDATNSKVSPLSEKAYFSTGVTDWDGAKWISDGTGGATANEGTYNHFWYVRKSDTLDSGKTVARATAHISGLQDYDLYVNNTEIGRGQSFDYASESRYQGWDITDAVKSVNDTITVGALVRTYGGGQGRARVNAGFLCHINVFYTDGTVKTITTDNTWKVSKSVPFSGTTKRNSEGDFVENYNAQNAQEGFTLASFDDSAWAAASDRTVDEEIIKPVAELSKPTDYIVHPVSVKKVGDVTVADFGKVIPARPMITFANGTAGKAITIYGGYELTGDGTVDTSKAASQSTDMRWIYTQKAGAQTYNAWDHLGFRYLQISDCGEALTTETIAARVVHTNVPDGRDSTLTTSNETLNNVYELMKRSSLYGIQNEFVDTPTREKGQFTDDSRNISEASMASQFEREASRKGIMQFLASADRYWTTNGTPDGRFNSVYPNVDGKRDIPEYSVNMPQWIWNYYMNTGDKATLEYAYPYMKAAAVNYIAKNISSSTGLVEKLEGGSGGYLYGIVDWPASGRFGYDWDGTQNGARATVNMLSKNAFDVVALAAGELGYNEDKTDMESRARALKTAINTKLQNSEGLYVDGTRDANGTQSSHISQHANSFALAYGIATDENKQAVADYIAGLGMKQGPMTADILAKALFNAGENTAALRLFTEPHDYGWAREVANGYTFTFESWEADSLANEDSQSHAWGSTAASDILKNFAGVTVTKAGASEVKIAPVYVDLTSLDAQVSTERGKVGVSYGRTSSSFDITITVPANMKANIVLPDVGEGTYKRNGAAVERTMTVGSGTYAFTFDGTIVPPEEVVYKTPAENGIKGTNNAETNTYTYEIGNSTDKKSSYSDESDYVNLTVGLGTGDSLNEDSGIIFGGTAVPDSGGVDTTGRYLLVEPKRSGTFTLYATCTGSNNRIYYYDYGTGAVDLSAATKSGTVAANGITKNVKTKAEITMTAGNKYVIYPYTYGGSSIISELSYAYTDEEITSDTEYEAPDAAKTVTEPSGTSITLDHNTYPLVVGNASATDFTDWETRGSSFTLTAAADSNEYTASNITWSVDDEDIAYIRDNKTSGASTSIRGKRTGTTRAVASLPNGDKAVCYITVIDNVTRVTVNTLELNADTLALHTGDSATLIPIINPKDVYGNGVLDTKIGWASESNNIVTVNNGVVTAVAPGTAKIMAKSNDVGRKAYCTVTVTDGAASANTDSTKTVTAMTVGETEQLTAEGTSLTWKSDNPAVADVDSTGKVTAYSNSNKPRIGSNNQTVFENGITAYDEDTVNIYATAQDGAVTTFPVKVSDAERKAESVSIYMADTNVAVGSAADITAAVLPAYAFGKNVAWKSSNPAVATVTDSGRTVYGVPKATITGVAAGTATITASCDGETDTVEITVTTQKDEVSVTTDVKYQMEVDAVYDRLFTVTPKANSGITFESSDPSVVTVDNEGVIRGAKAGTATITAKLGDTVKATREVEVIENDPTIRYLHAPAEARTDTSVNLLWTRASLLDTGDFASYSIYKSTDGINYDTTPVATGITTLGYTVEALEPDTQYHFKVVSVDSKGDEIAYSTAVARTKSASTVINVMDKGATGDGVHMDTYAIQKAIDEAGYGDTILLPEGKIFLSGALYLKSNITFKVDGILLGSPYDKDYPATITRWEGWRRLYQTAEQWGANSGTDGLTENVHPHASLINAGTYDEGTPSYTGAYNIENLTICGKGMINANGFRLGYNEGLNQKSPQPEPMTPAMNQTVRGRAITLHNADKVYIKDVTVSYSPSWTIHPIFCRNLTVDGVNVVSAGDGKTGAADDITILNGDGIDPDSSTMVNLFNMDFQTGDDGVAIKTGKDKEGNVLDKPCAYIRVTDCYSHDSKGSIVIGSENASGTHDTLIQNVKVGKTTLNHTIWLKGCWSRGGITHDLVIRDIDGVDKFDIQTTYNTPTNNPADTVPQYKNITFENCNVSFTAKGFNHSISGLSALAKTRPETYLESFTIRGCPKGGSVDYAKNFTIIDPEKESNWSFGTHTENMSFVYSDSETSTKLKVKSDATHVSSVDNDNLTITAATGTSEAELLADIESLIPDLTLGYSLSADGKTLTVTAKDGTTTANYTVSYATIWDFAKYTIEVKLTADGVAEADYNGLEIVLAGNGNDSDHDKITTDGVYWRGGASSGESVRYIKYTPTENGTLTVTGKLNGSSGRLGISTSLDVTSLAADGSSTTSTSVTTFRKECVANTTYYIIPKGKSATISTIAFTPAN